MTIALFIIPGIFLVWDILSLIVIGIESRKREKEAVEKMKQPHLENPKFIATYKPKKTSTVNPLNFD